MATMGRYVFIILTLLYVTNFHITGAQGLSIFHSVHMLFMAFIIPDVVNRLHGLKNNTVKKHDTALTN